MKKLRILALLVLALSAVICGIQPAQAATSLPESVVSDSLREVEYIEYFPVIMKTVDGGKYYIYCLNMSATYAKNVKFTKKGTVDPGFVYILNNRPQTSDKDRDFYITQMAVWYYEDYLNQNNFNLELKVKQYILSHYETDAVCKNIIDLLEGAQAYAKRKYVVKFETENVTFTQNNGYYESNDIKVYTENINEKLNYTLVDAPAGALVENYNDYVKVKVPVDSIEEGKRVDFSLNVEGKYTEYTGYYYYHSTKYQKVLFQDPLENNVSVKDTKLMGLYRDNEHFDVEISKTDIVQSQEVEGATLVIKDEAGNIVDTWVSTKEAHKTILKVGKYSLTETIAPKGYKLSSITIEFLIDDNGALFIKNDKGVYVGVDKLIFVNELMDVVSFAKKDKKTDELLSGATLVIKDSKGNVVKEFVTDGKLYSIELAPGEYSLSEKEAPEGYIMSEEVVYFKVLEDGTLKVKNDKNKYVDSAVITFYNTQDEVPVPATDANATVLYIGGIALLFGGIACAKKTIKEC